MRTCHIPSRRSVQTKGEKKNNYKRIMIRRTRGRCMSSVRSSAAPRYTHRSWVHMRTAYTTPVMKSLHVRWVYTRPCVYKSIIISIILNDIKVMISTPNAVVVGNFFLFLSPVIIFNHKRVLKECSRRFT